MRTMTILGSPTALSVTCGASVENNADLIQIMLERMGATLRLILPGNTLLHSA
ncbi:MAG: hypothetical protein GY765_42440 [bacterium]|nr:hypothetical protein [bacterium]